jgi:hypothetical protein
MPEIQMKGNSPTGGAISAQRTKKSDGMRFPRSHEESMHHSYGGISSERIDRVNSPPTALCWLFESAPDYPLQEPVMLHFACADSPDRPRNEKISNVLEQMLDPRSEIVSRLRKKTGGTGQKKQT